MLNALGKTGTLRRAAFSFEGIRHAPRRWKDRYRTTNALHTNEDPDIRAIPPGSHDHGFCFLASLEVLWDAVPIVRHHHENWDGTGYPDGLKGEEIPLEARIIAVCDYYDVLTNFVSSEWEGRAKTHDEAVEIIKKESGKKFDPSVVDAFLKVFSDEAVE